jgi:hypothetical protein
MTVRSTSSAIARDAVEANQSASSNLDGLTIAQLSARLRCADAVDHW